MAPPSDDTSTLAVVVARLDDLIKRQADDTASLTAAIESLRREFADSRREIVARGDWIQRNQAVDTRFQDQGREIAPLRPDLNSKAEKLEGEIVAVDTKADGRRPPCTAVAAAIAAVAALVIALVTMIAR